MMDKRLCLHCFVSGKVQGVFYRASTAREARQLNLTGWVRNLADGRVEVFACGDKDQVSKLQAWLREGPELAEVTEVVSEECAWQSFDHFEVR